MAVTSTEKLFVSYIYQKQFCALKHLSKDVKTTYMYTVNAHFKFVTLFYVNDINRTCFLLSFEVVLIFTETVQFMEI